MRTLTRLVVLHVVGLPLLGAEPLSASTEPTASAERSEQRFVLFEPDATSPTVTSRAAKEQVAAELPGYEVIYSRWVRQNTFDPATAAPGDRLVFHISPGESYELIITKIENASTNTGTIWYARLSDSPYDTLSITFARDPAGTEPATVYLGSFQILEQRRQLTLETISEAPGWALLKEITPRADRAPKGNDQYIVHPSPKAESENPDSSKK